MTKNGDLNGFGTGVAFRLGGRLFLITAGHNLVNPPFEVMCFAGEGSPIKAEVLNCHFHPDSNEEGVPSDMGFVELTNREDIAACDFEQIHIGSSTPTQPTQETIFLIAGFPEVGHTKTGHRQHEMGLAVIPGRLESVEERILQLHYDKEGFSIGPNGEYCEEMPFYPTPRGFSGGGVWQFLKPKSGELFDPVRHVKMGGTDYAWHKETRTLYAMRSRISIPFFFEKYPDLKVQFGHLIEDQLAR